MTSPIWKNGLWDSAPYSSSCLLGKVQDWHKVCQVWCSMEFLLISSKTDKETLARCISIIWHGNSSWSGEFLPPVLYPPGLITRILNHPPLNFIAVLGAFYHKRMLWHPISLLELKKKTLLILDHFLLTSWYCCLWSASSWSGPHSTSFCRILATIQYNSKYFSSEIYSLHPNTSNCDTGC